MIIFASLYIAIVAVCDVSHPLAQKCVMKDAVRKKNKDITVSCKTQGSRNQSHAKYEDNKGPAVWCKQSESIVRLHIPFKVIFVSAYHTFLF
jgi:hypothetical protein